MSKNIGKNICKILTSKHSQKVVAHTKQSTTDALKTAPKRAIQKEQKQPVIWLAIKFTFL